MMAVPTVRNDPVIEDDNYVYRLQADLIVSPIGEASQHFPMTRMCEREVVDEGRAFLIAIIYRTLKEKNLLFGSKIGNLTISQERIPRDPKGS